MIPDHYAALGVEPGADHATVRAAYLEVMRRHHPDRRPHDPASVAVAQRANAAYAVLGDTAARAAYDRRRGARTRVVHPSSDRDAGPAYSPEKSAYHHAVSLAMARIVLAIFLLGTLALVAFS